MSVFNDTFTTTVATTTPKGRKKKLSFEVYRMYGIGLYTEVAFNRYFVMNYELNHGSKLDLYPNGIIGENLKQEITGSKTDLYALTSAYQSNKYKL